MTNLDKAISTPSSTVAGVNLISFTEGYKEAEETNEQ